MVNTCNIKNKLINTLSTAERSSQVTSVVNFIPSKIWSLPQGVSKVVLHTGLNAYRETSGGSWFVTSSLLLCYDWSKTRSTSCTNLIFPVTFTKACPIPIQKNIDWLWIEIKEIPKYKLYGNLGDLSKTTFWYHSNDTKRNPWVVLCSHCPINDSSGYLHIIVYLAVMLQASWHTAEGN